MKNRLRIEQTNFGPELLHKMELLLQGMQSLSNAEDILSQIDVKINSLQDLYDIIDNMNEQEKIMSRLIIIEGTITEFASNAKFYFPIPYKAVELKTVEFTNKTNTDKLSVSISEKDDFSDYTYMSLESERIYDILNLPIIDANNNDFKLKVHLKNVTNLNNRLTINYKIKLTGLVLKENG